MAAAQLSEKILAPPAAPTAPISPPPSEQILLLTTRVSPQPQPSGEWRRHSTSTTGGASLEPSGQRPRTPKHDLPPHRYAGNRTDVFLVTAGTSEGRRVALVAEVKLCLDHAAMTYIRDSAPSNARHGRVTKDQDVENVGHDLLDQLAYSMRRTNARMGAITNGCDIVVVERDFDFDRSELKRTATKELQLSRYEEANRKRLQETVHERLLEEGHGSDHPQAGLPRRSRRMTEREEVSRSAGRRPVNAAGTTAASGSGAMVAPQGPSASASGSASATVRPQGPSASASASASPSAPTPQQAGSSSSGWGSALRRKLSPTHLKATSPEVSKFRSRLACYGKRSSSAVNRTNYPPKRPCCVVICHGESSRHRWGRASRGPERPATVGQGQGTGDGS